MIWRRVIAWIWIIAIPAALAVSLWVQRRLRAREEQRDIALARVDAFLTVWARTWGQSPEVVKPQLETVLQRYADVPTFNRQDIDRMTK